MLETDFGLIVSSVSARGGMGGEWPNGGISPSTSLQSSVLKLTLFSFSQLKIDFKIQKSDIG
jgi:hypothetical protein